MSASRELSPDEMVANIEAMKPRKHKVTIYQFWPRMILERERARAALASAPAAALREHVWQQPFPDEQGGRRSPSWDTECETCGSRISITNNYSPMGDFLDQSVEPAASSGTREGELRLECPCGDIFPNADAFHEHYVGVHVDLDREPQP